MPTPYHWETQESSLSPSKSVLILRKSYSRTNRLSSLWEQQMNLRHEIVSWQNLKDLPAFRLFPYSCQYCVYWESTDDFDEKVSKERAQQLKSDWFRSG